MLKWKKREFWQKQIIVFAAVFMTVIMPLHLYRETKFQSIPSNAYTGTHQWLTASTVKFCNIWFKYGARNLNFLMYEEPFLIENHFAPDAYISYPPGTLIPVFAAAKLMKKNMLEPSFVKKFITLIYYLMIQLFAAWSVVILHRSGAGKLMCVAGSIAVAAVFAYLSPNYYYLRHVFFSDQMVLPYALVFLILEYLDFSGKTGKKTWLIRLLQMCVVAAGCFTDYLFCMLITISFLIRLFSHPVKPFTKYLLQIAASCWQYVCGALLAFTVFALQLYFNIPNALFILKEKFIVRSYNTNESFSHLQTGFWWEKIHFLHPFAIFLLSAGIIFSICFFLHSLHRKQNQESVALTKTFAIILWGSLLHTAVFFQHSWVHEFSVLKYCIVITVLAMLTLHFACLENRKADGNRLFCTAAAVAVLFFPFTLPEAAYKNYAVRNYENIDLTIAKFILRHADKNDVLFSFSRRIPQNPPFEMSISGKRLFHLRGMENFPMDKITPEMNVGFVLGKQELALPDIKELLPYASSKTEENGIVLLRFKPSILMEKSKKCQSNYRIYQTQPLPFKGTGDAEFRLHENIFNVSVKWPKGAPQQYNDFFIHIYQKGSDIPVFVNNFSIDLDHLNALTGRTDNTVILPPEILAKGSFIKFGQFIPDKRRLWEYDIPVNCDIRKIVFPELDLRFREK